MTMANLLNPPPLQDTPLVWDEARKQWRWTPNWEKWFSNVSTVMGDFMVSGRSTLPATLYSAVPLLEVPSNPTTQINSIVSPDNGLLVYDSTTDQLKVTKSGSFVVIV